jgi:hypothetical protein
LVSFLPSITTAANMATSMYNHHRFARAVMKKFRKAPASLTIELHSNHWLFQGQVSLSLLS